jgi:hypothetical protein
MDFFLFLLFFPSEKVMPTRPDLSRVRRRKANQAAIIALSPVINQYVGNLPSMPWVSVSRHGAGHAPARMTPRGMAARVADGARTPDRAVLHRYAIRAT